MTDTTDPTGDTTTDAPAAAVAEPWYCDQCGARYAGPGICENQHAPTELVELEPDAAAETGQDPAPVAAAGLDAPPADAGTADNTAAADPATTSPVELTGPETINIGTTVSTEIGGIPYSGSISVSLTKQQQAS